MSGSCKHSPSPFKTCVYICVLSSLQTTADTKSAGTNLLHSWCAGLGVRGSGKMGTSNIVLRQGSCGQAGARPCWDSQTQFLLKPCKKIPGTRIACWDSPSCYFPRGLSHLFILWEKSTATVSFAYLILSEVISSSYLQYFYCKCL